MPHVDKAFNFDVGFGGESSFRPKNAVVQEPRHHKKVRQLPGVGAELKLVPLYQEITAPAFGALHIEHPAIVEYVALVPLTAVVDFKIQFNPEPVQSEGFLHGNLAKLSDHVVPSDFGVATLLA